MTHAQLRQARARIHHPASVRWHILLCCYVAGEQGMIIEAIHEVLKTGHPGIALGVIRTQLDRLDRRRLVVFRVDMQRRVEFAVITARARRNVDRREQRMYKEARIHVVS